MTLNSHDKPTIERECSELARELLGIYGRAWSREEIALRDVLLDAFRAWRDSFPFSVCHEMDPWLRCARRFFSGETGPPQEGEQKMREALDLVVRYKLGLEATDGE
jgi:hypothetical protein